MNVHDLLNLDAQTTEAKVYQMMETSLIVSEVFMNLLYNGDEINEDYIYGESESDTYSELVDIALEIERINQTEKEMYVEDIKEKAEELILKKYGKPALRTYTIRRDYWKEVTVEAESYEDAKQKINEGYLFDKACLEPGDTELCEIDGIPVPN